jgi:N-acetylglucosaminyldiphosphoundecaprenol N-acetyl-beta-D-mannosaminyltransferase
MNCVPVFGVDCVAGDLATATDLVIEQARNGSGGYICLANVHVVVTAGRNTTLNSALGGARAVFADGAPVAWMQRRAGLAASRVAGADLMASVLDRGRAASLRHFLFGSTDALQDELMRGIASSYPGAQIVGRLAPARGEEDSDESLEAISSADADVVWAALGAPKQELWAARHAQALAPALVVVVGAAFDFLSGAKQRAPQWMQDKGLEWVYRLASEPRRLSWRYVSTNTLFLVGLARHR